MEKKKIIYVLPKLTNCIFAMASFDMWMSKSEHDIFALVINLLGFNWKLKQVTINLFEATKNTRQTVV